MTTVSFDALVQSADINVRTSGKMQDVEALAASILAKGVLQPLAVRKHPIDEQLVEIVDGDRRYAAIKLLIDRGDFDSDIQIPVHYVAAEFIETEQAREASLAANIERVPLHPIDEFEAFSALAKTMKPDEIAQRFGVSEKQVRQRIALGALHPDIREAWRAGGIGDETARAFTLTDDQNRQIKIFNDLTKKRSLWANQVRAALGVDQDVSKAIRLIGADAYRAAGGEITENLFGDGCVVSDPKLAQTLAADFLKKECDRLIADGWSFAILADEVKDRWNWPRLNPSGKREPTADEDAELKALSSEKEALEQSSEESDDGLSEAESQRVDEIDARIEQLEQAIELRRWGARQKAKAGCFVGISYQGNLEIAFGVQNPKNAKKNEKDKTGKDAKADDAEEKPAISASLALALSEQLTIAAAKALAADPDLALRVAVAALQSTKTASSPLKLTTNGLPALAPERPDEEITFETALDGLLKAEAADVLDRLADAIAPALDLRAYGSNHRTADVDALLRSLTTETFLREARAAFDAEAYFKSATIGLCHAALNEMGFGSERPKKKGDLVTLCVEEARARKWLPAQLRQDAGS